MLHRLCRPPGAPRTPAPAPNSLPPRTLKFRSRPADARGSAPARGVRVDFRRLHGTFGVTMLAQLDPRRPNGMLPRRTTPLALIVALAAAAPCAAGEKFTTENFAVDAPTKELARTFGEYAEKYRSEKALDWLGYEMP